MLYSVRPKSMVGYFIWLHPVTRTIQSLSVGSIVLDETTLRKNGRRQTVDLYTSAGKVPFFSL